METVNDLGFLVNQHLTFSEHINRIVQKAACRSYLVFKCFQSRNTKLLVPTFTAYVRPLLEVKSRVWSPHLLKDIRRLVVVIKRRFTETLLGMHAYTYPERLKLLGLERLEERIIRADIAYYLCTNCCSALQPEPSKQTTFLYCVNLHVLEANHPYKLFLPRCSTDVRVFFLSPHLIPSILLASI